MFHTPPSVNPSFDQESRLNSYTVPEDDTTTTTTTTTKLIKHPPDATTTTHLDNSQATSNNTTTQAVLDTLQMDSVKLPEELSREFDNFIKFLKLPKFNRPLNLNDISKLYQQFYNDFNNKSTKYWNDHYGNHHEHGETELLTKDEILQRNELITKSQKSIYLSNLLIEKLVCNKYYKKIFKSDKRLVKDELNRLINEKFNAKLLKMNELNISLHNLDLDLNLINEQDLINQLRPLYMEMFDIRSPTLKLLKFKKIHEQINQFLKKMNIKINGDYYLPILIYSIINIKELSDCDLILELNFIKNFKNNTIYENNTSNETGELLYILTNLDACLIYLLNVTLTDLKISTTSEDELLIKPISVDESTLTYCEDYNMIKKFTKQNNIATNSNSSSTLDYYSSRLQEYAFYNADHGIRTINSAFDSSVKSIFARFLPSSSSAAAASEIDKQTLAQIEENFNNKIDEDNIISPVSTTSTLNTSNSSSSSSTNGTTTLTTPSLNSQPQPPPPSTSPQQHHRSNSITTTPLKSFSSGMSGVIKQFRPISNSNSSTSLHTAIESSSTVTTTTNAAHETNKTRSRGTSLIGEVFSQPARSSSASIINTIEHAFEGRRSRGNSLLSGGSSSHNNNNLINELKLEFKEDSKKRFEDMSINDLRKMFDNYTKIMNN